MNLNFKKAYEKFWNEFGKYRKMVLSSSKNDFVTSRMMSIIVINEKFYFQTDKSFRKYEQLKANPNISLCIDNIQIEGKCYETCNPSDNISFSNVYKQYYPFSYNKYSLLKNECVFEVIPNFIERWQYIDDTAYIEIIDIENQTYSIKEYIGV